MKKNLVYLFTLLSILLLQDCVMYYFYAISFAGYYSDLILFWLWFSVSIAIIIVFWRKILAKTFFVSLIITLIGSLLMMMIPFYAFVLSMTNLGLRFNKNINEKYRVQVVGYSVMTHPWLEIIEKKGIFEKKILECTEMDLERLKNDRIDVKFDSQLRPDLKISQIKDIIFESENDKEITFTLFYGGPNKTITFDKTDYRIKEIR